VPRLYTSDTLMLYGKGTLMTVFTIVTDAFRPMALPFSVVIAAFPAVEIEIAWPAMMVPTIVRSFLREPTARSAATLSARLLSLIHI